MSLKKNHIVSVVIPTTRCEDNLNLIKAALSEQTRPADETIIVKDEERRGAAWARNNGIAQSKGDLVAFLDDDCVPPTNWLESLINAIDNYRADGAGGTYRETDPLLIDRRKRQEIPDSEMEDTLGLVGAGGNLMFTRSWLESCIVKDGFVYNEELRVAEDWELIIRSRQRNVKLIYIPVRVKHLKSIKSFTYLLEQIGRGKGIARLYQLQKTSSDTGVSQKSLLWGKGKNRTKWFKILWVKGVGPFDVSSFDKKSNFIVFWLGEKFQSLGFLWFLLNSKDNPMIKNNNMKNNVNKDVHHNEKT